MFQKTAKFENVWSQIKQKGVIFQPLEVVGRGSETQLQVTGKIKFSSLRIK